PRPGEDVVRQALDAEAEAGRSNATPPSPSVPYGERHIDGVCGHLEVQFRWFPPREGASELNSGDGESDGWRTTPQRGRRGMPVGSMKAKNGQSQFRTGCSCPCAPLPRT